MFDAFPIRSKMPCTDFCYLVPLLLCFSVCLLEAKITGRLIATVYLACFSPQKLPEIMFPIDGRGRMGSSIFNEHANSLCPHTIPRSRTQGRDGKSLGSLEVEKYISLPMYYRLLVVRLIFSSD